MNSSDAAAIIAIGIATVAITGVCAQATQAETLVPYVVDLNTVAFVPREFEQDAYEVSWCESRWDPEAVSDTGDYGLFQINKVHRARVLEMGYKWADMLRPIPNIEVAVAIWQEQGWKPWSCKP